MRRSLLSTQHVSNHKLHQNIHMKLLFPSSATTQTIMTQLNSFQNKHSTSLAHAWALSYYASQTFYAQCLYLDFNLDGSLDGFFMKLKHWRVVCIQPADMANVCTGISTRSELKQHLDTNFEYLCFTLLWTLTKISEWNYFSSEWLLTYSTPPLFFCCGELNPSCIQSRIKKNATAELK